MIGCFLKKSIKTGISALESDFLSIVACILGKLGLKNEPQYGNILKRVCNLILYIVLMKYMFYSLIF